MLYVEIKLDKMWDEYYATYPDHSAWIDTGGLIKNEEGTFRYYPLHEDLTQSQMVDFLTILAKRLVSASLTI